MQTAIEHLKKDPILASLIEKLGDLPPINQTKDVFQALVESIISQQLSTKAADTIYKRFLSLAGNVLLPGEVAALDVEHMRGVGISYQKASYIHNVAQFFIENPGWYEEAYTLDDETLITKLTQIKGVGLWTVQMLLIFELGRLDILPLDDLIVRKGIVFHYGLDEKDKSHRKQCLEIAKSWEPYRTIASRYMWASKDMIVL